MLQAALARAKLRLGKGRTTILGDSNISCNGVDGGQGSNAHNALTLISDYGMESDEEEDEDDEINTDESYNEGDFSDGANLGAEDPLASFFDELQHEGLLEENKASQGLSGMSQYA